MLSESGIGKGLGALAAIGLAAGGCAYATLWPTSQIFGRAMVAPARPNEIALTFDDGPNPACTPRLLELLARHGVRATFFLIGRFAAEEQALTRSIANAGHVIGNHSWSHPNLALSARATVREELRRTSDTLEGITGSPVRFFRPPYGARRPYVLRAARELGMSPVLWNAMTDDWKESSADRIADRIAAKIDQAAHRGRGANTVLHDGGEGRLGVDRGPSVKAVEMLLSRYASARKFVTVAEWTPQETLKPA